MKTKILIVFQIAMFIWGVTNPAKAQIKQATLTTEAVRLFEKAEWNIELIEQWQNPYLKEDVSLDMEISTPSGKKLIVPCYYESGKSNQLQLWKARFAAREVGKYTCKFILCKNGKTTSEFVANSFKAVASDKKGFLQLNNNYTFKYDNGEVFRGIGENICWEARSNDDSKFFKTLHENARFNYEFMLPKLVANGGNFTRVWICSWNFPLEWQTVSANTNRYTNSTAYYNTSAIVKLDRLFVLADSLNLHIMLALAGGGGFETGNYSDKTIGFAESDSAFFVNPKSKLQYKNKLRYLIARWGYSPSIGAWEFFNEVDYLSFSKDPTDTSRPKSVTAWHHEMSTYLKANDPYKHLVTTSISHKDVEGLNLVPNIDFNQKHSYKNTAGIPATIIDYTEKYKKPYVIGEFGYEWDWSKNFDLFANEMDSDFKRGLWYGLFSPTPILPMSWWWEYFENRGMMSYFARVRYISDRMLADGKGNFEQVDGSFSSSEITVYGVKCGKSTFVYLFNPTNEVIKGSVQVPQNKQLKIITLYTCETGETATHERFLVKDGTLSISDVELAPLTDKIIIVSEK
ncbi:MAG TPA: glycoside hydrolase [Bacteroidales bacterium]|nr:glycoside hydrolase [Bacteroidales bacterium]